MESGKRTWIEKSPYRGYCIKLERRLNQLTRTNDFTLHKAVLEVEKKNSLRWSSGLMLGLCGVMMIGGIYLVIHIGSTVLSDHRQCWYFAVSALIYAASIAADIICIVVLSNNNKVAEFAARS